MRPGPNKDLSEAVLTGEILDAKCWFGAMRPGHGKAPKACAALCARGGLPLAIAELARCAEGKTGVFFLDHRGMVFGPEIVPLVAKPAMVRARNKEVARLRQLRVKFGDIRKL